MDMDQCPAEANGTSAMSEASWYDAFPRPRSSLQSISPDEVVQLIKTKEAGKDYIIVDVRRTDFEDYYIPGAINLPAHSFYPTLAGVVPVLSKVPLVIFHCQSCGKETSRGRLVAGWYQDALDEANVASSKSVYLEGGIKGWIKQFKDKQHEGLIKKL